MQHYSIKEQRNQIKGIFVRIILKYHVYAIIVWLSTWWFSFLNNLSMSSHLLLYPLKCKFPHKISLALFCFRTHLNPKLNCSITLICCPANMPLFLPPLNPIAKQLNRSFVKNLLHAVYICMSYWKQKQSQTPDWCILKWVFILIHTSTPKLVTFESG